MAARKVQIEMEKVFKKVDEGLSHFEELWDKVYDSAYQAQRDKNEDALKKELKKLQRLRQQINQWLADNAIKIKTKLVDYRSKIEEKMEMFKASERDSKLKAFSNVGLMQHKIHPDEKEKEDAEEWITEVISQLKKEYETGEAELEALNSVKKKKKRKDNRNTRASEMREKLQRHEHHVQKLERVLRALLNGNVTPQQIWDVKDGVEYYLESNEDPSFIDDEELYDELDLEPVDFVGSHRMPRQKREKEEEHERAGSESNLEKRMSSPEPENLESRDKDEIRSPAVKREAPECETGALGDDEIGEDAPRISALNSFKHVHEKKGRAGSDYAQPQDSLGNAAVVGSVPIRDISEDHGVKSLTAVASSLHTVREGGSPVRITVRGRDCGERAVDASRDNRDNEKLGYNSQRPETFKDVAVIEVGNAGTAAKSQTVKEFHLDNEDPVEFPELEQSAKQKRIMEQEEQAARDFDRERIRRCDRIVTTMPRISKRTAAEDLARLQTSLGCLPEPELRYEGLPESSSTTPRKPDDGDDASKIILENMKFRLLVHGPRIFPSSVPATESRAKFLKKVDVDVLFFIFYYQQETDDQFLAAIELRQRGWKLHKRLQYWFLKKGAAGDLEAYSYFDFKMHLEAGRVCGWCEKRAAEFDAEENFILSDLV